MQNGFKQMEIQY